MKKLIIGAAIAGAMVIAAPVSAQTYGPMVGPPFAPQAPIYPRPFTPEMMDNGSSSDFPTHTPSDFVADQLNRHELTSGGTIIPIDR